MSAKLLIVYESSKDFMRCRLSGRREVVDSTMDYKKDSTAMELSQV